MGCINQATSFEDMLEKETPTPATPVETVPVEETSPAKTEVTE